MEHDFQMLSILFNIDFIVISKKSTSSVICRCYLKSGFFVPSSVILIFPLKTVKREQFVHIYMCMGQVPRREYRENMSIVENLHSR